MPIKNEFLLGFFFCKNISLMNDFSAFEFILLRITIAGHFSLSKLENSYIVRFCVNFSSFNANLCILHCKCMHWYERFELLWYERFELIHEHLNTQNISLICVYFIIVLNGMEWREHICAIWLNRNHGVHTFWPNRSIQIYSNKMKNC